MSSIFFSNPAGFWALLGLPAIILIHFLQRESRRIRTSTLFLLDQLAPESAQGRRFERLRNSASLWLQILAVLLLAWLLACPRWIRRDSTQNIAIVLDSSASMSAFTSEAKNQLAAQLPEINAAAADTVWTLLESDSNRAILYRGNNYFALLNALQNWHPNLATHDFKSTLRTARSIVRNHGSVILISDHLEPVPPGITLLAVGTPFENHGFTGLRADDKTWRVLVKNYGAKPVRTEWKINGQARGFIEIPPGHVEELRGDFPNNVKKLSLELSSDRFALDDTLPLVQPQPKSLGIGATPGTPFDEFFQKFTDSITHRSTTKKDFLLARYDPLQPRDTEDTGIVFLDQPGKAGKILTGAIIAQNHPLVSGLNWQGLQINETLYIPPSATDEWLVSQGDRPLIFLRRNRKNVSLMINFDLRYSNAARIPAFILTLDRFAEMIRAGSQDVEVINVETNQILSNDTRAPAEPGFFEFPEVKGGAHFADTREADFSKAASSDGLKNVVADLRQRNSEQDFLTSLWTILLFMVVATSWWILGTRKTGVPIEQKIGLQTT